LKQEERRDIAGRGGRLKMKTEMASDAEASLNHPPVFNEDETTKGRSTWKHGHFVERTLAPPDWRCRKLW